MAPMEMILPLMTTMAMKAARGDTRATLVWRENYTCALVRLTLMDLRTQRRGRKSQRCEDRKQSGGEIVEGGRNRDGGRRETSKRQMPKTDSVAHHCIRGEA
jgi:hypothetical protein